MSVVTNSIVIANFNGAVSLRAFLSGLKLEEAPGTEAIVVDNASFDESAEIVRQFPTVKFVQRKSNHGLYGAYNRGITDAQGEVVVVCHNDIIASSHELLELADRVRELDDRKLLGVIPHIQGVDGVEQANVGPLPGVTRGVLGTFTPHQGLPASVPSHDHLQPGDWARFVCCAFRRETLDALGGFSEKLFLFYGDADLCARMHEKNHRLLISRNVRITHAGPAAGKPVADHLQRIMRKDARTYFEKHGSGISTKMIDAAAKVRSWIVKE